MDGGDFFFFLFFLVGRPLDLDASIPSCSTWPPSTVCCASTPSPRLFFMHRTPAPAAHTPNTARSAQNQQWRQMSRHFQAAFLNQAWVAQVRWRGFYFGARVTAGWGRNSGGSWETGTSTKAGKKFASPIGAAGLPRCSPARDSRSNLAATPSPRRPSLRRCAGRRPLTLCWRWAPSWAGGGWPCGAVL